MPDSCANTFQCRPEDLREALSISTKKITDSCRDKDCIEDLRVYLTRCSQATLDGAAGAKVRSAELIYTNIEVEHVAFDRNHYCVDVTFYYRILADTVVGCGRPATLYGLAVFSKRAVLCGEDSKAHIFTSDTCLGSSDGETILSHNCPTAVVEVLDPMVLSSKVREICDCHCSDNTAAQIPNAICRLFDEDLVLSGESKRLYVTLGQFSIIRLERDVQLVIPVIDYAMPTKECCDAVGCAEDPCEMFSKIPFPDAQFSPKGCDCATAGDGCCGYTTT